MPKAAKTFNPKKATIQELKSRAIFILQKYDVSIQFESLVTNADDFVALRDIFINTKVDLLKSLLAGGWYDRPEYARWKELVEARVLAAGPKVGLKRLHLPAPEVTIDRVVAILKSDPKDGKLFMLADFEGKRQRLPIDHAEVRVKYQRRDKNGNRLTKAIPRKDSKTGETKMVDVADYVTFSVTSIELVD